MTSEKEMIKTLLKVAQNQQKILNKIAQQMGASPQGGATSSWNAVETAVSQALSMIPEARGCSVVEAEVSSLDGNLRGKVELPADAPEGTFRTVLTKLKGLLAGKSLNSDQGSKVSVTSDPSKITFIALT